MNRKKTKLLQEILTYTHEPTYNIRCADIDAKTYQLQIGDDQPSVSSYDFKDNNYPIAKAQQFSSEVTALCSNSANDAVFCGTLGGTIQMWNYKQNKKRSNNPRILLSGAIDTNVKIWDIRMKTCINTFKSHNEQITCVDISPDCFTIISGSQDGTIKLWDLKTNKLQRSMQVSNQGGYPSCLSFNPMDLCVAVGTSEKIIKYWELQDYSLVSQTNIENYIPQKLLFDKEGKYTYIGFYDCVKVYLLDDAKPKVLDIIPKGGFRDILDLKINADAGYLFTCEQSEQAMNQVILSNISLSDINFNPNVKPSAHIGMPNQMSIEQKPLHQQLRKGLSMEPNVSTQQSASKPSLLAKNGLNLMGHSQSQWNQDFLDKQQRPPSSQSIKTFYQQPKFDQPSDLKLEDFLNDASGIDIESDMKSIQEAVKDHNKIIFILKQRNEILQNMLKYWSKNDTQSTINCILTIKDPNIIADALGCTFADQSTRIETFNFDHAISILKKCEEILTADKFETHLTIAIKCVKNILQVFTERINTIVKTSLAMGEDFAKLSAEQMDRKTKCDQILERIEIISKSKGLKKLINLSKTNSNLLAKNIQMDMENLIRNCKNIPTTGTNGSFKNNFL
ncbi:katanin p80 wd40 repeat-containing subunit b1 homolog [Stylonychia lemnae]|uniref:Katanin p80 wd40 repeat-containing subunit b1 homolog n=1 Tax=Stylonychia lemnae TaxID=5949 RepID=A0A078B3H2_STYLE|nr:katanin p80 wd40 repeat-containing subunit b1 homolog [Stylonychia lemnae]|eukprot:CDW88994.1 katanin p80 wd40 repeat-containing subunit b1 homolog [Stylonychia lemnae]